MPYQSVASWQPVGDMAQNYEDYFVSAIFRPWATDLLRRAAPRGGERVVDIACGTGIVSRLAAEQVGAGGVVVGLDINPAVLEVARSKAGPTAAIRWQQASADAIPFPDGSFDVAVCQQALQFFPDRIAALSEMHRVLSAGGRLAVSVWRDVQNSPGYSALAEAMARHVGPEPASFVRAMGALDSREVLEADVAAAGFHEVVVSSIAMSICFPSPEDFVWQFVQATPMALFPCVSDADTATRSRVVNEVAATLRPYVDVGGLVFPMSAHIVSARK